MNIRLINQETIDLAERFATQAHEGQKRKYGDEPYINHPRRVAMLVAGHRLATTDMVVAAWLHDTVEDCDTSLMEIYQLFGPGVLNIVDAMSKKPGVKKVDYYKTFKDTTEENAVLKLCDRLDNVSDLKTADRDFQVYYRKDTARLLTYVRWADEELARQIEAKLDELT